MLDVATKPDEGDLDGTLSSAHFGPCLNALSMVLGTTFN